MQHLRQRQCRQRCDRDAQSQDQLQPVTAREIACLGEQVSRAFRVERHMVQMSDCSNCRGRFNRLFLETQFGYLNFEAMR